MLDQNGNSIPNWVYPPTLIALEVVVATERQRLQTHRASDFFQEVGCNHDVPIVAKRLVLLGDQRPR